MTAGQNGTPDGPVDDPFAYLYRGEGGAEAPETGQAPRPGVPRTSYHQVSRVGERRPAPPTQAQPGGYGYPPPGRSQQGYQPQPPQTQAYGAQPPHAGPGRRSAARGAPPRRGLMIGAIAVVVVVAVIIVVAALAGNGDNQPGGATHPTAGTTPSETPSASPSAFNNGLPEQFAASLTLTGGAKTNNNHTGAQGPNGVFVDGMNTPGAAATWTATVPQDGSYTLWVRYANADGNKATSTVVVNGKPLGWKINLADYGQRGNWDSWFSSYVTVNLKKGANSIALTCGSGDTCNFNLDRIGLTTAPDTKPQGWS